MEHSSGSDFINQYFTDWFSRRSRCGAARSAAPQRIQYFRGAPRSCRWTRLPNPAKQGGCLPVTSGSSSTRWRGTITTVTLRAATSGSYRFGKIEPGRTQQGALELEQLLLLAKDGIELRLDRGDSTLRLTDVKAAAEFHGEKLVRDVERRHHRDALGAGHFPGIADVRHLRIEVCRGAQQRVAFAVGAGHLVGATENRDVERLGGFWHRGVSPAAVRSATPVSRGPSRAA